ncbi:S8 family serine peptidase [Ruegeria arenilitoris]|uniref:S8 family serine peptidase n=1 Tax=Ruegeria arenilitoris TaxID=1173585 RepID=UPI00147C5EA2|nr:S8 family serine peptidase [Ruegeria arenilitoris]
MPKKIDTYVIPTERESAARPPSKIIGYVSVNSKGKTSVYDAGPIDLVTKNKGFHSTKADRTASEKALNKMGFEILAGSRLGFSVAGPPEAYEELTGGKVSAYERLVLAEGGARRYSTHLDIVGSKQPECRSLGRAKTKTSKIEGVMLEEPKLLHGIFPPPIPPNVEGTYLQVPHDVSSAMGAAGANRAGHVGEDVRVAMVDSGQYAHPYFDFHSYNVASVTAMVPGTNPAVDPNGHGTGESANIFALAPGIELHAYRATNDPSATEESRLVAAASGFIAAKEANPQILTNSWGNDTFSFPPFGPPPQSQFSFIAEIVDAVEQGIFVVFSAGNGSFSTYAQIPGVFSAGGVFMERDLDLRASNYASGYTSPDDWFPGRIVPDASGLVGMLPRAQYIMLPVPAGSELDVAMSNPSSDAPGDGTAANDGWARFSGTSAAAPQIAGAGALILGARPDLTPAQVIEALSQTATDVVEGSCHPRFGNPAGPGRDEATGFGLVNASAALDYALTQF